MGLNKLSSLFSNFKSKFSKPNKAKRKKKRKPSNIQKFIFCFKNRIKKVAFLEELDFSNFPDTKDWLGAKIVQQGEETLNNRALNRNDLVIHALICERNWEISLEETKKVEGERDKLQKQLNLFLNQRG
jgi:hypothetical protein